MFDSGRRGNVVGDVAMPPNGSNLKVVTAHSDERRDRSGTFDQDQRQSSVCGVWGARVTASGSWRMKIRVGSADRDTLRWVLRGARRRGSGRKEGACREREDGVI